LNEKLATITCETLPVINAVPGQMESLFCIFISNSLKFSKSNPVIQINCTLDAISDKPAWKIEFSDNGIGFDMKYSDKIFKIFQRLHAKDEYPGTGLGLALAKRIVENHGGAIRASSEAGKGATFTILIPKL
jgi:light-regulated signal transduction histidine kinase (bacteriophytochrome)